MAVALDAEKRPARGKRDRSAVWASVAPPRSDASDITAPVLVGDPTFRPRSADATVPTRFWPGGAISAFGHASVLLSLLLIAPAPRLGEAVPEPATVGLVLQPPPAPEAPPDAAAPPPKPAEPTTETPPAPAASVNDSEPAPRSELAAPPGPSAELPLAAPAEAARTEPVKRAPKHQPAKPARHEKHGKPAPHGKHTNAPAPHKPQVQPRPAAPHAPEPVAKPPPVAKPAPPSPAPLPQAVAPPPAVRTAPLPKVWTPTAQPTPNAPPPAAAPQATPGAPAPASNQPAIVNAAWAASVSDWLVQNRVFPTDARLRNVQGVVVIRFSVAPDGQVSDVTVLQSSGRRALDQAAIAMIRGARLPPFPPDMTQPTQSITVPIRYGLE